jgi:hypothetical protein
MSDGTVPVISTTLGPADLLGAFKVRWGIGRMNYTVQPGLYAVGNPDTSSPVLVSANYKLTFDTLRKHLSGLDCRLLILDTKGINVWCAAGKGTLCTDELVNRIKVTGLAEMIRHKKLILPQLAASGINAQEVLALSGFSVIYGPVRANDIKEFIASGLKATEEMRTVRFTLWNRLVLTPVEIADAAKKSLVVFGILFLINLFAGKPFGIADFIAYTGAVLTGSFLTPLLLPFIPGKAFSWKGWLLGLCWTAFALWFFGWAARGFLLLAIGYMLLLPAVSAYFAMNFTGSSTYTSQSGVLKEMKIALPFIIASASIGSILVLIYKCFA